MKGRLIWVARACSLALGLGVVVGCTGAVSIADEPSGGAGGSTAAAGGSGAASGGGGTGGVDGAPTPCDGKAEVWVSADGACGAQTPCYTSIQTAIDQAGDGGTVWVLPGTYGPTAGEHVVDATAHLSCVRSVEGADVTILDGQGLASTVVGGYQGALWLQGFTARGGGPTDAFVENGWGVAIGGWSELRGWILDNIIEQNFGGRGGVGILGSTSGADADVLVSGNVIRNNDSAQYRGALQLEIAGPNGTSGLIRVENNLVVDNQRGGVVFSQLYSSMPDDMWTLRIEVVNNTIANNSTGLVAPVDRIFVHNNIVAGNDDDVYLLDNADDTSVLHNLFADGEEFVGLGGNFAADPMFVAVPEDYSLQATSPGLGAGTSALAPKLDIIGTPRDEAAPDVGAFETP